MEDGVGEVGRHGAPLVDGPGDDGDGRSGERVLKEAVGHLLIGESNQGEVVRAAEAAAPFTEGQRVAKEQIEEAADA